MRSLTLATALALLATPASAACMPGEKFLQLVERHGERLLFSGVAPAPQPHLLQLWVDRNDGSWTVAKVFSSGRACVMSVGMFGEVRKVPVGDET